MAHVTTRKARSKVQGVTIPRVPGHLTALAERTCDSMRFTAALRRFIAPSKHKMPAGSVHAQMERELCTWLKCHKGAEKNLKNNQSAEEIQWKSANGISEIKHQKLLEYNWRDLIRVVYLRVHCVVDNLMQKFSFLRMHDD
ncbi:hypothetical protein PV328_008051 [Microctonus aethiopoides]|uniref:Uncharacterized protein n=1 Tax=Microctonus aethiopoides TaxID=144406 RepID=A0AA39F0Y9_9HYME|nr:hypothetical protein PV328_008051 [Microctonus aethiopoides]